MQPKLSIIIPCYNHGQYLQDAIDSVEQCTDKTIYELIIINDGSTDDYTIKKLKELEVSGYNIVNQQNQGLGAARNNGIRKAVGNYILPLDSDNKIRPEYIYKSIEMLDAQSSIAVVYGNAAYFGDKNGINIAGDFNLQKLMLQNYIDACAVFRKDAWKQVGGYDEKMPVMGYEDWDFWLNLALNGYGFKYIPEVLYDYRVLKNSMINSIHADHSVKVGAYMQAKYKKYLNHEYLNEYLLEAGNRNKKIAVKLLMALYFPGLYNFLIRKKTIKSRNIF